MNQLRVDLNSIWLSRADSHDSFDSVAESFCQITAADRVAIWRISQDEEHMIGYHERSTCSTIQLTITHQEHIRLLRVASAGQPENGCSLVHKEPTESVEIAFFPLRLLNEKYLAEVFFVQSPRRALEQPESRTNASGTDSGETSKSKQSDPTRVLAEDHGQNTQKLLEFVQTIHAQPELNNSVIVIANKLQSALSVDRVTVFLKRGAKWFPFAISNQSVVNRKSKVLRNLSILFSVVVKLRRSFSFPSDQQQRLQAIKDSLHSYCEVSPTRFLVCLPLFDSLTAERDREILTLSHVPLIGGIVYESFDQIPNSTEFDKMAALYHALAEQSIVAQYRKRKIFLYPVWSWLGKSNFLFHATTLPKTILASLAFVVIALVLALVPADLNISCNGEFVPIHRRRVFAEIDGRVKSVNVKAGEPIVVGQKLAELTSEEIDLKLADAVGQLNVIENRKATLELVRLSPKADPIRQEPSTALENIESIKSQITSLKAQIEILERIREKTAIISPIRGNLLTWDSEKTLTDRPVKQGDLLFEIADLESEWQLELVIPDRKAGRVLDAYKMKQEGLEVSYVLASSPSSRYSGMTSEISNSSFLTNNNEQGVLVFVDIDENNSPVRHSRSTVVARINCGRASLGYVWFCEVFDYCSEQIFIWF